MRILLKNNDPETWVDVETYSGKPTFRLRGISNDSSYELGLTFEEMRDFVRAMRGFVEDDRNERA